MKTKYPGISIDIQNDKGLTARDLDKKFKEEEFREQIEK